ncbi:PrpF domain-containing protein [Natrialba sp. INN-245]|uniref:2-methylaconitate cis-trans isomerase PrpF family protein n=1 Tax=Natrialba sp. INN-245 TaxID=2690967 RepID=UPI0013135936|nr:PrpF domain-containing protein [Natrialba sp. INN-245]MWV38447.1 PrpF protein [Natrialba sp. INN-245]
MAQQYFPASLFRGGTSKGVYIRERELPADRDRWDDLLLQTFGSPDPKQIDGVGGSHSTASKAMIISPGDDDIDVEYLFGQVGIEKPVVDWGGNCGNLSFAIGPFALERGVATAEPDSDGNATLRLRNENTGTVVEQTLPVDEDGNPRYRGEFTVNGVPGTGARIRSRFLDPGGSVTDAVFPTGNRIDTLDVPGVGSLEVSLVDVSNPCVFARASDLSLTAAETPATIDSDEAVLERLERVRSAACERLGFVDDAADATAESPGIPKMTIVGEPQSYETVGGETIETEEYDLLARIMSMQKAHHAYAVTGAMCTATAGVFEGTIPNEFCQASTDGEVTIAHPKGTMWVGVERDGESVEAVSVDRTARELMHGDLYYLDR